MKRLQRRTSVLYSLFAFAMLLALEVAGAAIALLIIDRGISSELRAVAARVPAIVEATKSGSSFSERADSIIASSRSRDVSILVREAGRIDRFSGRFEGGDGLTSDRARHTASESQLPAGSDDGAEPAPLALVALFAISAENVSVPGGNVLIFPSSARLQRTATSFFIVFAVMVLLAVIASVMLGRFAAERALKPLRDVVAELFRFGAGDFEARPVDEDPAGYEELTLAYNAAASQVSRALGERAKAELDMRRFIADAAHELRTPLTVVSGYFELLRGGVDLRSQARAFATIEAETRRMRELISSLLALARLDAPQLAPFAVVDLSTIVEDAVDAATLLAKMSEVRLDIRTGALVSCDAFEMREAIDNVLTNAIKYAPGAALVVSLQRMERHAVLEISDDGPGMSLTDRENAFRRFYRGENGPASEGSGLGLSIVERVITRASGTVALETAPGAGVRVTIELPLALSDAA